MKLIPLTREQFAKVDDKDYEKLAQSKWFCSAKGYACRELWLGGGKRKTIYMHAFS